MPRQIPFFMNLLIFIQNGLFRCLNAPRVDECPDNGHRPVTTVRTTELP
jgi:hypothetical protein